MRKVNATLKWGNGGVEEHFLSLLRMAHRARHLNSQRKIRFLDYLSWMDSELGSLDLLSLLEWHIGRDIQTLSARYAFPIIYPRDGLGFGAVLICELQSFILSCEAEHQM